MENEQLFDGYCALNSKLDDLLQIVRSQETSMYRVGTSAPLLLELYDEITSMLSLLRNVFGQDKITDHP